MPVVVTVTYRCGGCPAITTAPDQVIRREFVSLSGRDHGLGSYVLEPVKIESVVPEGWVVYDPYTMCTYCPPCWAAIGAAVDADQPTADGT